MRNILLILAGIIIGNNHSCVMAISFFSQNPHPAVLSSLMRGLNALKVDYNVNPSDQHVHSTVVVLDGIDYLRHLITLKNNKHIQYLLTGPNLMNRVCDYDRILANPSIDIFFVPSKWVEIACLEDEPRLAGKIAIWYAGVDIDRWQPNPSHEKSYVLVYWKTDSENFCQKVEELLKKRGYNPTRLKYGTYNHDHYKNVLDRCEFAVFISRSESQGIALAEAWAMNVPTFVWNPGQLYFAGKHYNPVSACPYLTDKQGKDWVTLEQLDIIIQNYQAHKYSFSPRQWIKKHMTDIASAQLLLTIIDNLKQQSS